MVVLHRLRRGGVRAVARLLEHGSSRRLCDARARSCSCGWSQAQYISHTTLLVSELAQETNARLVTTSGQLAMLNEGLIRARLAGHLTCATRSSGSLAAGRAHAVMTARGWASTRARIERVRRAALLHDLGKIGIPDAILLRSEPADAQEYEVDPSGMPAGAMIDRRSYSRSPGWRPSSTIIMSASTATTIPRGCAVTRSRWKPASLSPG